MFCSVCGSQNAPQLRFCRACGKPLSSAETLSADADDPLKTRLSIPADQSALKAAASQPPPSAGADPMATVVGMQAVKAPPVANASSAPDPFATQVGGQGLNINQLKEMAAKSASPPPSAGADPMATVVGMQAVKPLPNANASSAPDPFATQVGGQGLNIDQLKELAAKSAANKNNTPAASNEVDNLATVVGMPAINLPIPPKAAPTPPAPPATPSQQPLAKAPESKPPIPPPQQDLPSNNMFKDEAKSGSSTMMIVGIVIAVVLIIVSVLLFRK